MLGTKLPSRQGDSVENSPFAGNQNCSVAIRACRHKGGHDVKLFFLLFLFTGISNADSVYSGNGCPPGTAAVVTSPDGKDLTILFDRFVAEAGGAAGILSDSKECRVETDLTIPEGFRIGVYKVDYRGFVLLPHQAFARLNVDYSLDAHTPPPFHRRMNGIREGEFLMTDVIGAGHFRWFGCGPERSVRLAVTASWLLEIRQTANPPGALAALDTTDIARRGAIKYRFIQGRCP
jgi:hypothetical protein